MTISYKTMQNKFSKKDINITWLTHPKPQVAPKRRHTIGLELKWTIETTRGDYIASKEQSWGSYESSPLPPRGEKGRKASRATPPKVQRQLSHTPWEPNTLDVLLYRMCKPSHKKNTFIVSQILVSLSPPVVGREHKK